MLLPLALAGCPTDEAPPVGDTAVDRSAPAPDQLGADTVRLDLTPATDSAGSGPPYPIVLAHGFFGFDNIGPLDYFHNVKQALEADGHVVIVASMDPFNGTYVRGNQLLQQVHAALLQTGAARVNIIGHSQGGLDARYVASLIPDRVGAVVTVATPHLGAHIADVLLDRTPGFTQELAKAFFAAISRPFYGDVAKDADVKACLESLTTDSLAAFNLKYPDEPGVTYYSFAGRSSSDLATTECFAPVAPPFVTQYAKDKDPVDPLLYLVSLVVGESLLSPKANDGLVQVSKTKWGTWLGCVPADHWDEVGQLLGDSPGGGNPFNHITFYRDIAQYLVAKGF